VHVIVIYLLESLPAIVKFHKYLSPLSCGQTVM